MTLLLPVAIASAGLMIVMAAAWAIHRATHNAGWIDAFWTFGVGACACAAALYPIAASTNARQLVVAALGALWSLRLGIHIMARNLKRPDDPRYAKKALDWGVDADRKFFWFLQQQAWCGAVLILSITVAAQRPGANLSAQDAFGALILLGAILGEAVADAQLRRFATQVRSAPGICDIGLWSLSRHPNYFFEWLVWMAFPVIAIDASGGYPYGWLALSGTALMYWLLVYVSGIPPLEEQMIASRGRLYEDYRTRTNAFFPWRPKR